MKLKLKRTQPTELLSLRVPTEMRNDINKIAKDNNSTNSEIIRYAIKNLLQDA